MRRSPTLLIKCSKKIGLRNFRFLPAKQSKIAVFSRKAKMSGVSTKCILHLTHPLFSSLFLLF